VLEQNALVINTGDKLVLLDTGLGILKLFGPKTGMLMNSLSIPRQLGSTRWAEIAWSRLGDRVVNCSPTGGTIGACHFRR
jgi:hypothetical protein